MKFIVEEIISQDSSTITVTIHAHTKSCLDIIISGADKAHLFVILKRDLTRDKRDVT